MEIQWLGIQKYQDIDRYQKAMVPEIRGTSKVFILGMEFYPVITLGLRAEPTQDVAGSQQELKGQGFEIIQTDRGGQATLHNPGQVVIYPMLDLRAHSRGVKNIVQFLMTTTQRVLEKYQVKAVYEPAFPGLYTPQGKIAFCGLKIDQGVVRHGLSVNVKNHLEDFQSIRSCGQSQARLDQVQNYSPIEPQEFFLDWIAQFQRDFRLSAPQSIDMNTSI